MSEADGPGESQRGAPRFFVGCEDDESEGLEDSMMRTDMELFEEEDDTDTVGGTPSTATMRLVLHFLFLPCYLSSGFQPFSKSRSIVYLAFEPRTTMKPFSLSDSKLALLMLFPLGETTGKC